MGSVEDILQLCRLCLVKDQVNIPIFDESSDIRQTFLKISSCLPVKVTREDNLPKRICDECSYKLDMLYIFRNTSTSSEKQLLTWLDQVGLTATAPHTAVSSVTITKPEIQVKQETFDSTEIRHDEEVDAQDYLMQQPDISYQQNFVAFGESSQTDEGPPPKRVKRAAALKQTVQTAEESDEEDMQAALAITKAEGESDDSDEMDEPDYVEAPSTSADDQPGPSGVGKDPIEAPKLTVRSFARTKKVETCPSLHQIRKSSGSTDDDEPLAFRLQQHHLIRSPERTKIIRNMNRTWSCDKCQETFRTSKLLRAHRKSHTPKIPLKDPGYKFDSIQDLYVCNTCSAEFQNQNEVEKHAIIHEEIFQCEVCNEKFERAYNLGIHLSIHSDDTLFKCPLCTFKTSKSTSLLTHINHTHLRKFYYSCSTCGKGFNDAVFFKEHENEHLGIRPFICVVCNKDFIYSRYLHSHQIRNHRVGIDGELLPNQCSICMKTFSKMISLQKHLQGNHVRSKVPPEKKHLCDLCGKGFARRNKLMVHYRVHTGVKPYVCSYCSKSFTKKDYLVMHERVHSGEKPYSCEYCGKCFSQGAPLRIHLRGHTGERPYVCNFCNNGFASRGALNIHCKSCKGGV